MMHISVVSLGKSVASTSLATGLASVLHDRRHGAVLIELDPSGGDLAAMWGLSTVVGINNLVGAIAVEELMSPGIVADVAVDSPLGFPVVVSTTWGDRVSHRVCGDLGNKYGRVLASGTMPVVCDAGRWQPGEVSSHRVAGASVIIAVFTPDPAGVSRVARQLGQLRDTAPDAQVLLAVVGENPYPADEIEAALGGESVIVIPSQRRIVRAFMSGNGSKRQVRKLKKSLWWRSLARVIADAEGATGIELTVPQLPVETDELSGRKLKVAEKKRLKAKKREAKAEEKAEEKLLRAQRKRAKRDARAKKKRLKGRDKWLKAAEKERSSVDNEEEVLLDLTTSSEDEGARDEDVSPLLASNDEAQVRNG